MLQITVGSTILIARWERERSPRTCAAFARLLPFSQRLVHARWSGEACWIPLGSLELAVPLEAATTTPAPGEVLFYPGGISETEILIPYGPTRFGSVAGPLAGNHFLTIVDPLPLAQLGRAILIDGSQPIHFCSSS